MSGGGREQQLLLLFGRGGEESRMRELRWRDGVAAQVRERVWGQPKWVPHVRENKSSAEKEIFLPNLIA